MTREIEQIQRLVNANVNIVSIKLTLCYRNCCFRSSCKVAYRSLSFRPHKMWGLDINRGHFILRPITLEILNTSLPNLA